MARILGDKPYSITFNSFIAGHHVYKGVWSPVLGEDLTCLPEPEIPMINMLSKSYRTKLLLVMFQGKFRDTAVTH